ncbi:MAG: hypothetical protein C0501_27225 [Isosphaera sp.]|nr:hypothetical protein [Isosphaera sp.]
MAERSSKRTSSSADDPAGDGGPAPVPRKQSKPDRGTDRAPAARESAGRPAAADRGVSNRAAREATETVAVPPVPKGVPLLPADGRPVRAARPEAAGGPLPPAWVASYGPAAENVQGGFDERQRVADPTAYPWRAICRLVVTAVTGRQYLGTGWLISPTVLATAGHNVFMHAQGGWAQRVDVSTPFGAQSSVDFRSVDGWVNGNPQSAAGRQSDYGAILLPAPTDVGYLGYGVYDDADLAGMVVTVAGFPHDKDDGTALWGDTRALVGVTARQLFYDIDTAGGQSGCPVMFSGGGGEVLSVGIHNYGGDGSNFATRVTAEVYARLEAWKAGGV